MRCVQNKLARDAAAGRERDLQVQVTELRELLAAGGAAGGRGSARDRDFSGDSDGDAWEVARVKRELARVQQCLQDVEDEAALLRANNARLERETRSLQVRPRWFFWGRPPCSFVGWAVFLVVFPMHCRKLRITAPMTCISRGWQCFFVVFPMHCRKSCITAPMTRISSTA